MYRRIAAIVVSLSLITGIGIVSASSASAFAGRPGGIEGDGIGSAIVGGGSTYIPPTLYGGGAGRMQYC